MASDVTVGFTKNPRQLMAKARVASAANAPIMRVFCIFEDMFGETPWARLFRVTEIVVF
jgi:hypothetical protein